MGPLQCCRGYLELFFVSVPVPHCDGEPDVNGHFDGGNLICGDTVMAEPDVKGHCDRET